VVIAQAAGFALLAAISPTSLLVMAVFLGSDNPRRTALAYLIGAVLMTVVMAAVVLVLIRVVGLDEVRERTPRYWVRFGLGVLSLAGAALVVVRGRRAAVSRMEAARAEEARKAASGVISRLTASPSPRTAFLGGVLLFAPSTTFIAAVQVVAIAQAGLPVTAAGLIVIITLTVAVVWVPFLAYLAAPEATTDGLQAVNGWLHAHGRTLVVGVLTLAGVVLVVNGLLGALTR
jgi:hypothetical protein